MSGNCQRITDYKQEAMEIKGMTLSRDMFSNRAQTHLMKIANPQVSGTEFHSHGV